MLDDGNQILVPFDNMQFDIMLLYTQSKGG